MPLGGAVIGGVGAVGSLVGGLISSNAQKKAQEEAIRYQKEQMQLAVAELERVGVPTVEAQKIVLQNPELVGLQTAEQLGPSELQQVKANQAMASRQKQALEALAQRGEAGFTPEEKAQRNDMLRQVAAQNQAQQSQILQNMAERGMGGSGNELVARLQASQAGANTANQQGENLAAQASQRALEAIGQSGNLAGQLRSQEFGEQSQAANAADAISKFNLQNRQNISQQNAALQQQQANTVAGTANTQEQANKALIAANYQQQLQKAQSIANARTGNASTVAKMASDSVKIAGKEGEGIGTFVNTLADAGGKAYPKLTSMFSPSTTTSAVDVPVYNISPYIQRP